ncbi:glycerate kinase [Rubritalea marina]|uniref:glycerate kinase n=1 Tax=Rubritalea marina TaxID=361055 RepID=UPI00035CE3A6|nr:glycerate kinase [Rubritalea marina]
MRILVACDKFKGSLTAAEACESIERGLIEKDPSLVVDLAPIADGGEGFTEALKDALDGEWVSCEVVDALGRPCVSQYVLAGDTAVMEMAASAGLLMIEPEDRDPWHSSTFGVGLMLRHAVEVHGVKRVVMGIGGSATNELGAGFACALGARLFDADGNQLEPVPANFQQVAEMDLSGMIKLPEVLIASDVRSPLLGERGASHVFGPQKGVENVSEMEAMVTLFARLVDSSARTIDREGAGAAGGLGFGLMHFAHGELVNGFDWLAKELEIDNRVRLADVVITGEGSLDAQSLEGKGPVGLARMARSEGKRVIACAGRIDVLAEPEFDACHALDRLGLPLEECIARGAELLQQIVAEELQL